MSKPAETKIGLVGLGYVGLPLAVAFGKNFPTVGFDIDSRRISELTRGYDRSRETTPAELKAAKHLSVTASIDALRECNVYIVTVPTPVDRHSRPDFTALLTASKMLGTVLKKNDIVVFESTVYPGATEEVCVPAIERASNLQFNTDFFVGYSPERINPGDKTRRLETIVKVTSGSTPEAAQRIDDLYQKIIPAGTHRASSIRVAEAAKVIENTQRDINIALMNELAVLFDRLGLDTLEVLEAAGTKWNFLPFRPGLVGGHCIGVDPYYLTHKAQEVGYHPEVILSGRRINDSMGAYIADRVVKTMTHRRLHVVDSNVLVMGITFKEHCPDVRNSKVADVIKKFSQYNANVDVFDPWADADDVKHEYGIQLIREPVAGKYSAIILAVAHQNFVELGIDNIRKLGKPGCVVFDVKGVFPREQTDGRL